MRYFFVAVHTASYMRQRCSLLWNYRSCNKMNVVVALIVSFLWWIVTLCSDMPKVICLMITLRASVGVY
jgi:hypothetical protein